MSERKRSLKLASRIPSEEIAQMLKIGDDMPFGYFLIGDEPEHSCICCWHVTNGLMILTIEDGVLGLACRRHLLAKGALTFRAEQEVLAYADAQGWPGRR
ncbi:MAG: hypothetical protein U0800_20695 [Isosphaeraceae bacterium]